ncbi:RNA12 protein-domain-containing protein [Globomyces pollinis-pini]|nr:RNA12 protein-domain-containing protein [Globomyces pollinis-pini]
MQALWRRNIFQLQSNVKWPLKYPLRVWRANYSVEGTNQNPIDPLEVPSGPSEDPDYHKGVIWFDNIFPFKLPLFDPRTFYFERHAASYVNEKKYEALLPAKFPEGAVFKAINADPNLKEGGLYLEFKYKGGTVEEAVEAIQNHLENTKPVLDFLKVNAYQVKGTPWVEDLVSRKPSPRLHVQFIGPDLTVESLFREFRGFGRIVDIVLQPSSSKDLPRFASVHFLRKRSATSARNCIHGEVFGGTKLLIGYEKVESFWHKAWQWINTNMRISVFLILAFIASFTFIVFDPWRVNSITNRLTGRYSLTHVTSTLQRIWTQLRALFNQINPYYVEPEEIPKESQFQSLFNQINPFYVEPTDNDSGDMSKWSERQEQIHRLSTLLKQTPDNFILISGPRGSGKTQFIEEILSNKKFKLKIRCDELVGKSDFQLLSYLSSQVNFFPTFGFMAQLGGYIDMLITATTGAKGTFTTTNEGEINKILECVTLALEKITFQQQKKRQDLLKMYEADGIDEDELAIIQSVEYPVVVIDDFLGKENIRGQHVYDILAKWAAQLAEYRICQVVFVSENPSATRALGKVLPTKSVEHFHLADAKPETALEYVKKYLGPDYSITSNDIAGLGGRMHDLDIFVTKLLAGLKAKDAFDDMVHHAVSSLRKIGRLSDFDHADSSWTPIQFWKVVELLSEKPEVSFDELCIHPIFGGNPVPLHHMERAGIITCSQKHDRPYLIRPGRPLYKAAFELMAGDEKQQWYMRALTAKQLHADYTKKVRALEEELTELTNIQYQTGNGLGFSRDNITTRREFVVKMIGYYGDRAKSYMETELKYKGLLKLKE